jgi:hypothetical protein
MNDWSAWEIIRRQVAICGFVTNESGERLKDLSVSIVSMPDAFTARISGALHAAKKKGKDLNARLDQTLTRNDGNYFFLDLPAGRYILKVVDPVTGFQDEKTSEVKWDKKGNVKMATVNFQVSISKGSE